jgi:hypothetical protein
MRSRVLPLPPENLNFVAALIIAAVFIFETSDASSDSVYALKLALARLPRTNERYASAVDGASCAAGTAATGIWATGAGALLHPAPAKISAPANDTSTRVLIWVNLFLSRVILSVADFIDKKKSV